MARATLWSSVRGALYFVPMSRPTTHPDGSAATGLSVGLHLRERYGIEVTGVVGLDAGVFRVDRRDGPSWVARLFPADRALADVEQLPDGGDLLARTTGVCQVVPGPAGAESSARARMERSLVTRFAVPAAPLKPGRFAAVLGAMLR